jgi:hypothetical protein
VAQLVKAVGQDMVQEAPHELQGLEGHGLPTLLGALKELPAEGFGAALDNVDQGTPVTRQHSLAVTGEIFPAMVAKYPCQHGLGRLEPRLQWSAMSRLMTVASWSTVFCVRWV